MNFCYIRVFLCESVAIYQSFFFDLTGRFSGQRRRLYKDLSVRPLPYRSDPLSDMIFYLAHIVRRFYGLFRAETDTIKAVETILVDPGIRG